MTRTLVVASCCLVGLGAVALLFAGLVGFIALETEAWVGLSIAMVLAFGTAGDHAR